ncbi:MAG: hypothetical protein EZS28_007374 [Streblomastix strix]|uniref:Uncharacterized protein n=1 Tax=Streblomastix strix TaxID=222440 RepID=A0A5J4WRC5_9EUKA|nr:MAG: hypothetical protein EZS28_007374 [Streblomastix strix]
MNPGLQGQFTGNSVWASQAQQPNVVLIIIGSKRVPNFYIYWLQFGLRPGHDAQGPSALLKALGNSETGTTQKKTGWQKVESEYGSSRRRTITGTAYKMVEYVQDNWRERDDGDRYITNLQAQGKSAEVGDAAQCDYGGKQCGLKDSFQG